MDIENKDEEIRYARWIAIKRIYVKILKEKWRISSMFDKFYPNELVFVLRSLDCKEREIVRMPNQTNEK